jgi:hypothetical protein
MALTRGYVQKLTTVSGPSTCIWVGPDPATNELLSIIAEPDDTVADRAHKRTMTAVFAQALTSGHLIEATHPDDSGAVSGVAFPAPNTSTYPLQMDALEVVQTVQDLAHSVPLIAGKRTVVRVYLSYYGSAPVSISGQLSVRSGPNATPITVAAANSPTLTPANAGDVTATRNDATRSLNFVLPASATVAGQLAIRLAVVTNTATGASFTVGNESRPTVSFQPSGPLRVHIVRITYQQGTPLVTYAPTNLDYNLLVSWLRRAYPVGQVNATQVTVAATAAVPFTRFSINAQLAAIRTADVSAGSDNRTHYYALVSDGGFFMRGGAAGIPANPDPTVVASGPTGPGTFGWDFDGSYGDWYGGHEIAHTFGRKHPGFCMESVDDINNYPFPNGQLSTNDAGFAGFDVGDPGNGLQVAAYPGSQWRDVMTYCNNQWMSPYTYEGIRLRLLAEDAMPASAGAPGSPGVGSGGRPDERYPDRARTTEAAAGGAMPTKPTPVNVVAQVNLTQGSGQIIYVNPAPNLGPEGAAPGRVALRITGPDGTSVEQPARVQIDSELEPDEDRIGLVNTVILADPDAEAIELLVDGKVVDRFEAAGPPPVARAVRMVSSGTGDLALSVELEGPPRAGQTFSVQVSTDDGRSWRTVAIGLKEPSAAVDRSQFAPGQDVMVRVTATNGFTSSVLTSEAFRA